MAATENIAVLFTDLVGSTELTSSLTPDAADELRREHFSALRQAIANSGGTEIKNLGDGLMVVFSIASAALGCAVAMQQVVDRANRGAERPLGLRVGLSAGEATKEHDDYFGDPVVEAARLCAKAESGQVLVTDVVRAMAGRRGTHSFTSLGQLELKGLPDPIETLEVVWEPLAIDETAAQGVPLPARLGHRPGVGVIGRSTELATLESAVKSVASGEGRQLVLVSGEPGQGKTTLVAEFARRAHEEGITVLLGSCDEELGAPYRPFAEALSHFVANAPEALLRSHVAEQGGELSRMVPALEKRLGQLPPQQSTDPDTERYLVYAAVVGLLDSASVASPVVLVLDDLHWADKPSLQLLRHLVANTSSARILVIGTFRDAELSLSHSLTEAIAALHREPAGVSSIELKGLDDSGVVAFVELAAGHALDDTGVGLAHQLYRETDGNPFFVGEILRHLAESGAIHQDMNGRWSPADQKGNLALPHSVRTVIGTRVSRLGNEALKVLSTASVIGRDFDLDVLVETTGLDEDALIELLEAAQSATLVTESTESPGRYSFAHALIQHTLYDDLGSTRRARAHGAVGQAMERLFGDNTTERANELARHFFLATKPADSRKAIDYAHMAGEAALAALAPDEAVRLFSQALDLASQVSNGDASRRIDLLIGLGTAQRQAGIAEFGTTLLNAARSARDLGETDRLVTAALANSRGIFSAIGVVDTDRIELLESALEQLSPTDSAARAQLLARLCSELTWGDADRRLAYASEARAVARRLDDPVTRVQVFNDCAVALRLPTTLDEQVAEGLELLDLVAQSPVDPVSLYWLNEQMQCDCARAGKFDDFARCLAAAEEISGRLRQSFLMFNTLSIKVSWHILKGDLNLAEQMAEQAFKTGSASGQPDALEFYASHLAGIRYRQGRLGELLDLIADISNQLPDVGTYKSVLALAYIESGQASEALALLHEAAAKAFSLPFDVIWLDGITNYARVAIELKAHEPAERLATLLEPYKSQVVFNGASSGDPVATQLGGLAALCGHFDDAEAYFTEAAELVVRGDMMFSEAYNDLLWGRMLRQRGDHSDPERARELLESARHSAASRGYAVVERRAAQELSTLT